MTKRRGAHEATTKDQAAERGEHGRRTVDADGAVSGRAARPPWSQIAPAGKHRHYDWEPHDDHRDPDGRLVVTGPHYHEGHEIVPLHDYPYGVEVDPEAIEAGRAERLAGLRGDRADTPPTEPPSAPDLGPLLPASEAPTLQQPAVADALPEESERRQKQPEREPSASGPGREVATRRPGRGSLTRSSPRATVHPATSIADVAADNAIDTILFRRDDPLLQHEMNWTRQLVRAAARMTSYHADPGPELAPMDLIYTARDAMAHIVESREQAIIAAAEAANHDQQQEEEEEAPGE